MINSIEIAKSEHYTNDFYQLTRNYSRNSAEVIVPLVLELFSCRKAVDVGCGDGTWLKVFQEHGVEEILGIDGDYVDTNILQIPVNSFVSFDLKKEFNINQKFDIVISLEVAEHLPETSADTFIDSLINLGAVVLFSAAIPNQCGPGHINEQWQEYWAKKFYERGYLAIDYIRKKVWSDSRVAYWYSQNMLLYVEKQYLQEDFELQRKINSYQVHNYSSISLVHPTLYLVKLGLSDFWKPEDKETSKQHNSRVRNKTKLRKLLSSLVRITKAFLTKIV